MFNIFNFTTRDTTICVNDPILISGPDGFTYLWSTGATTQQESLGVEGAYSLQITDEYGCFATDTIIISIDPNALPNELYVPNAFTPNMDGSMLWEIIKVPDQINKIEAITYDYRSRQLDEDNTQYIINPTLVDFEKILDRGYTQTCDVLIPITTDF